MELENLEVYRRVVYWIKTLWYGECSICKVLLVDVKGWARGDCPKCGRHYYWL